VIVVHKIALDPSKAQEEMFHRSAGTARFGYNWALDQWQKQRDTGGKPTEASLRKLLNEIKARTYPWMLDVSKNVIQQAIKNLGAAFGHFFRRLEEYKEEQDPRRKRKLGRKLGYPRFKKKGRCRDSFRADNGPPRTGEDAVRVDGIYVILPVVGRVRMRERLRFVGQVKSAYVSRTADRWFVSLSVAVPDEILPRKNHAVVGVDLEIATLATVSDDRDPYEAPRPRRKLAAKRRRLAKALSRKRGPEPGVAPSKNLVKAKRKLARLEARMANIRIDAVHKATTDLSRTCAHIVLEDLSVQGMLANHKIANSLADVGFYEFRRQMEYKAKRTATVVQFAPRFFPSSKMCSQCGHVHEGLELKDRVWTCPACGATHQRDSNASYNLASLAESSPATVCGAASAGSEHKLRTKLAAVKQKPERGIKSHV
jgi:putative transposase